LLTHKNSVHLLTRKLGFCLIFGFFISCITLESTERAHRQITKGNYSSARSLLDRSLNEKPELVKAQFLKAYTYYLQAQNNKDISARTPLYRNMAQELDKTLEMSRRKNEVVLSKNQRKADNLIESAWSLEYETARELWESSKFSGNKLQTILHHTRNAAAAAPDSSITYLVQANALNRMNRFQAAGTALAKYRQLASQKDTVLTDQLGYLYLKSNKPDSGRTLLFGDDMTGADKSKLITLANSYRQNQLYKPAAQVLRKLIKKNSNSWETVYPAANNYYHYFEILKDKMMAKSWAGMDSLKQYDALIDLNNTADSLAKYTQLATPSDTQATRWAQLGTLHQNVASSYLGFRDFEKFADLDIEDHVLNQLNLAVRYLEKATAAQPDETAYWDQLYHVHRKLNNMKQAHEALKNSSYNPKSSNPE